MTRNLQFSIGEKNHMLTLISYDTEKKKWLAKCDCGNAKFINSRDFKRVKSCGCWLYKFSKGEKSPLYKHGDKFLTYFKHYKRNSEKRKICFDISFDEFKMLISKNCFYCDELPREIKNFGIIANGIDRLDPAIGYKVDNCKPCCKDCNWAKQSLTKDDFIKLCKKVCETHGIIEKMV